MSLCGLGAYELARPEWLWGLAVAAPLVLLHLVHRRRVKVDVPFLGLLREGLGPTREAARFKRLRQILSLLLRVGALALLVLALCGLRPVEAREAAQDLVIIVDADVTTGAVEDDGRTRFEHGLALAAAHVRHHIAGDVDVLLAAEAPVRVAPGARGREDMAQAVEGLARVAADRRSPEGSETSFGADMPADLPARGRSSLDEAFAAARLLARRAPSSTLVRVITSRAFTHASSSGGEPELAFEVLGQGTTRRDQTLVDVQVAPTLGGRSWSCRVQVRNDDAEPVRRTLQARVGETQVFEEALELPAGATAALQFTAAPPDDEPAWLTIELEGSDAFPVGDRVDAWLAPPTRPSVLVVHGGKARVGPLLVLDGLADAIDLRESGHVHVDDVLAAPPRDVTLVDGVALPDGALRKGAYLFIAPLEGTLPFRLGPVLEKPLVWRTAEDHPLMRWLDFTSASIGRAFTVSAPGQQPLAWADALPVVAEGETDGVRYIVLGLDPTASWMQVQVGFPLFLRRAILRLSEGGSTALAPLYRAGDVLEPSAPLPGAGAVAVSWRGAGAGAQSVVADLSPRARPWQIPTTAHGRAELRSGRGARQWVGRTGFADLDPARTIVPARPSADRPEAREARAAVEPRIRRLLLIGALAALLLDLLLRPGGAPRSRGRRSAARPA